MAHRNMAVIGAMHLQTASALPIGSKYSEKNELADFAMQRMFILIIKMKNVFNDSYPNKERSFRAESQAHALVINGSL
jgi:hypothetical protein